MKIDFYKLNQSHQKSLSKSLTKKLNINSIQTYNPILSLYMDYHNNKYSHKCFVMKSDLIIKELTEENTQNTKLKDGYIKFFFKGKILNTNNNVVTDDNVFIKLSPILDVLPYIMNEYNTNHNQNLSNIFSYLANKKINSYNNSCYIDSYFSYLANSLTVKNICPTFPGFYGTVSGIADTFDFDITEEYNSIKATDWYDEYNDKICDLIVINNPKLDLL